MPGTKDRFATVWISAGFALLLLGVIVLVTIATNLFLGDFILMQTSGEAAGRVDASYAFNFSGIIITAMSFVAAFYLAFVALDIFWVRKQIQDDKAEIDKNSNSISTNAQRLETLQNSVTNLSAKAEGIQKKTEVELGKLQAQVKNEERDISTLSASMVQTIIRFNQYISSSSRDFQVLILPDVSRKPKAIQAIKERQSRSLVDLEMSMSEIRLNMFGVFPSLWNETERSELERDALTVARTAIEEANDTSKYEKLYSLLSAANLADEMVVSPGLLQRVAAAKE